MSEWDAKTGRKGYVDSRCLAVDSAAEFLDHLSDLLVRPRSKKDLGNPAMRKSKQATVSCWTRHPQSHAVYLDLLTDKAELLCVCVYVSVCLLLLPLNERLLVSSDR